MKNKFIDDSRALLAGTLTGDAARVGFRLAKALDALEAILTQADAQFAAGDRHATFSSQTIEAIHSSLD